jgi:imidazolonepropionase-like amidohydrolase
MGGDWDRIVALRAAIAASEFPAPEILSPGPFLDGPHDPDPMFVTVREAADAPAAVAKVAGLGVDFLKVQSGLSREAHAAIAREAARVGLPFVGHIPEALAAIEVVRSGQRSIEHVSPALPGDAGLMRGCSAMEEKLLQELAELNAYVASPNADREEARRRQRELQARHLEPWDRDKMATLFREMKERGTRAVPTLIWSRSFRPLGPEDDGRGVPLALFPAAFRERVLAGRRRYLDATPPAVLELNRRIAARSAELVGELRRAGVVVLAGTDSTDAFVVPGFSLHQELDLLVGAGLSPLEALQSATIAPARFLGREAKQGTVEAGKRADLLLVDANPLEDIRNTRKIFALVAGGRLADRAALDRLLEPGGGAAPQKHA